MCEASDQRLELPLQWYRHLAAPADPRLDRYATVEGIRAHLLRVGDSLELLQDQRVDALVDGQGTERFRKGERLSVTAVDPTRGSGELQLRGSQRSAAFDWFASPLPLDSREVTAHLRWDSAEAGGPFLIIRREGVSLQFAVLAQVVGSACTARAAVTPESVLTAVLERCTFEPNSPIPIPGLSEPVTSADARWMVKHLLGLAVVTVMALPASLRWVSAPKELGFEGPASAGGDDLAAAVDLTRGGSVLLDPSFCDAGTEALGALPRGPLRLGMDASPALLAWASGGRGHLDFNAVDHGKLASIYAPAVCARFLQEIEDSPVMDRVMPIWARLLGAHPALPASLQEAAASNGETRAGLEPVKRIWDRALHPS